MQTRVPQIVVWEERVLKPIVPTLLVRCLTLYPECNSRSYGWWHWCTDWLCEREVHSVYETTQTVRQRRLFVLICGERPELHGTETLFSCGQSEAHSCAVAFEIDIMRSRRREESVLSRELPRGRSQTQREPLTRGTRGKLVSERTRNPD